LRRLRRRCPISSAHSITLWLRQLQAGDRDAARPLWQRYFQRLVLMACKRLRQGRRALDAPEDVALSAFDSFCRGAEAGRFPDLADRDNLWALLLTLTERKAGRALLHENRLKRGGGRVEGESALRHPSADGEQTGGLEQIPDPEPTPELAAQLAEELARLLDRLGKEDLRAVALAKMEGYSNAEIADRLGVVERTVERRLGLIRKLWEEAP
jgi:DNA-directed RNA polymerase specialized sigma24 family protein